MRALLKFIVVAPVAILVLFFAFANRRTVTVSFDPFASDDAAAFAFAAPLFLVLIVTLMLGVALGGVATWLGQGRFRRAARQARAELDRLRSETRGSQTRADQAPSQLARRA